MVVAVTVVKISPWYVIVVVAPRIGTLVEQRVIMGSVRVYVTIFQVSVSTFFTVTVLVTVLVGLGAVTVCVFVLVTVATILVTSIS